MFAGVSSSTCSNTEMRRRDRRWDSEVRPVRCSTSSHYAMRHKSVYAFIFTFSPSSAGHSKRLKQLQYQY